MFTRFYWIVLGRYVPVGLSHQAMLALAPFGVLLHLGRGCSWCFHHGHSGGHHQIPPAERPVVFPAAFDIFEAHQIGRSQSQNCGWLTYDSTISVLRGYDWCGENHKKSSQDRLEIPEVIIRIPTPNDWQFLIGFATLPCHMLLVGDLEHWWLFHVLGIIWKNSPNWRACFQRDCNHQPNGLFHYRKH